MQVKFHGPNNRVTGSCAELKDDSLNVHFLVDCGMQQGEGDVRDWNEGDLPFDPHELQFVLLTHAHLDHCGLLPRLSSRGFRGFVYCTEETKALALIILRDAATLPNALYTPEDVERLIWRTPEKQVLAAPQRLSGEVFVTLLRAGHILGATSVLLSWPNTERSGTFNTILFSGDIGGVGEKDEATFLRSAQLPFAKNTRCGLRYAVVESTYGARKRPSISRPQRLEALRAHIEETVLSKRGVLLLPAFAIERTQQLLFDLTHLIALHPELRAKVPVFFDAPMASRANKIYAERIGATELYNGSSRAVLKVKPLWLSRGLFADLALDRDDPQHLALVRAMFKVALLGTVPDKTLQEAFEHPLAQAWKPIWQNVANRRQAIEGGMLNGPSIIIASGGMCDGGTSTAYLRALLSRESTTVLFPGYCSRSTNGGRLLKLEQLPLWHRKELKEKLYFQDGFELPLAEVRADIRAMGGYSGHADQAGLVDWCFHTLGERYEVAAEVLFLGHGSDEARRALTGALHRRAREWMQSGFIASAPTVESPEDGDSWYDLEHSRWLSGPRAPLAANGDSVFAQVEQLRAENLRLRQLLEAR